MTLHLASLLLALSPSTHPIQEGADTKAFLEASASAVLTVDAVLKLELTMGSQTQNQETRVSFRGIVVDPSGLIMVPTGALSPDSDEIGPLAAQGISMKASTQEIRVVVGNEEKQYTAQLIAEEPKYRLSFLAITDLEDRKLEALVWAEESRAEIGDRVLSLSRLSKGYDYAPYVVSANITGKIKKPRRALMCDGAIEAGSAIYSPKGGAIGILTTVNSEIEEEPSFLDMISPSNASNLFIISANAIQTSIANALEEMKNPKSDGDKSSDDAGKGDSGGGDSGGGR